jgi:hypothetical protein
MSVFLSPPGGSYPTVQKTRCVPPPVLNLLREDIQPVVPARARLHTAARLLAPATDAADALGFPGDLRRADGRVVRSHSCTDEGLRVRKNFRIESRFSPERRMLVIAIETSLCMQIFM